MGLLLGRRRKKGHEGNEVFGKKFAEFASGPEMAQVNMGFLNEATGECTCCSF